MKFLNFSNKQKNKIVELINLEKYLINGGRCNCFCGDTSNQREAFAINNKKDCDELCLKKGKEPHCLPIKDGSFSDQSICYQDFLIQERSYYEGSVDSMEYEKFGFK